MHWRNARHEFVLFFCRDQFVDSILSCGLLIFLSPIWLDEIYATVREIDVFGFGIGGSSGSLPTTGLKNVLSDLDGFGSASRGARLLSDFRRLGPQQNLSSKESTLNDVMSFQNTDQKSWPVFYRNCLNF